MARHFLQTLGRMLGLFLIVAAAPAMAATQPTLYTINSGTPKVLGQGVQKSWPIKVNESNAFNAVFKGGMWLSNPAGGRIYVKYQRHILHDNGTWTWIGTVSTVHGDQSVILTFGKDGVFGLIPQASGYPLRIVTRQGQTSVVETDAQAMARSAKALRLYSRSDSVIPPRAKSQGKSTALAQSVANTAVQAAASGPVIIDVMVAYTPGFVAELGSQSLALTRIQNLVDMTNTAYTDSGVNQQIRLVNTVQVNYPDNTANQSALDDITGIDEKGNPVTIPASLQGIAGLRTQYGADLVTLIRRFDDTTQGNCGTGWLIGGNQAPITQQSNIYGYNVVSDGTSNDFFCLDTTFAHELGHNMGNAHDRADAHDPDGTPLSGAYPYSYGYLGTGTGGSFATIMAYGVTGDSFLNVFSNPNISICLNSPCGVADSSSNSADNAHSMNNTAATIATFEPTMVGGNLPGTYVHDDVNGDGKSDLIWRSNNNAQFAYWLMNGTQLAGSLAIATSTTYRVVASGDFNADGKMDVIWTDGTGMWMWVGNGSTFTSVYMRPYPAGWTLAGTGDLNRDGFTDLIWVSGNQIAEWLMNGVNFNASYRQTLSSGWRFIGCGDFDGDGRADLLLTNGGAMQMWTNFNNGSFTGVATHAYPVTWTLLGTGDVNGDGKDDLLWRDNSHTHFAYWIMNGSQLARSWLVAVTPPWKFGTAGDFNGDGLLDLVWYNGSQIVMWPGTSSGVYKGTVIHAYPAGGWTMLP